MYDKLYTLTPFFEEPYRQFHIRGLARLLKINQMTARSRLLELEKSDLIKKVSTEFYPVFKANIESKEYKNLKLFYTLEKIRKSGLVEFIEQNLTAHTIILFGSCAKSEDYEKSDIDIAVISNVEKEIDIDKFSEAVNRQVSIHKFTKKKWKLLLKANPELAANILSGILLAGYVEL